MGLSSVTELPLFKPQVVASKRTVRFKGVYWHKGVKAYTTRDATGMTYKSPGAAAAAIDAERKGLKPSTIVSRARAIQCIYRGILPADAADMHQRAPALRTLVLQEPSLEPLMLQLKYGPWRSAVAKAWQQHRSSVQCPVFTKRTLKERARSLHTVLVAAVEEIAQTGVSRRWARNCGRSVGRHAGGVPVLRHLGVLVAAKDAQRGMRFHDRSARAEDSDDSDDEDQEDSDYLLPTAWKFGSAKKSLA